MNNKKKNFQLKKGLEGKSNKQIFKTLSERTY